MPLTSPTRMPETEEERHHPPGPIWNTFGQPGRGDHHGGDREADGKVESPETMTNSCPAARIIRGAARLRKARKTGGSVKFGLRMAIQTSKPRRT